MSDGKSVFTNSVIFVCSLVFLANLFLDESTMLHFYSGFAIIPNNFLKENNYLTLITYQFLHLNFQHIISNMFVLFNIGRAVESEIGSTKFGLTYLLAGAISGLLHTLLNPDSKIIVIGASGSIFGALALLLLLMPFKFTSAMIIPLPGVILGLAMLIIEVTSFLFSEDLWVAHDIHLYGFITGGLASFGIDYNRALRGLIISIVVLIGLYYLSFYIEGVSLNSL